MITKLRNKSNEPYDPHDSQCQACPTRLLTLSLALALTLALPLTLALTPTLTPAPKTPASEHAHLGLLLLGGFCFFFLELPTFTSRVWLVLKLGQG